MYREGINQKSYGAFISNIFSLVLTESPAMPQPKEKRPPNLPQGCHIEIKTVYETIEKGNFEVICTQKIM